jgi:hypothetical protein
MDSAVAHPRHGHCDLAPPRETISPRLGADVPQDGCHHGEPLTIFLPCLWRVDLGDHRLGPRRVGGLTLDGQLCAACLGVVYALFPKRTRMAGRFIRFISAVDGGAELGPTGVQFEDLSRRPGVTIRRFGVGTICARPRLNWLGLMTSVGGNAWLAGAKRDIRHLGLPLRARTLLHVPCARVMTVGTEALAVNVIGRPPKSVHGGVSSRSPRRPRPILLAVTTRFGRDDDLRGRISEGVAVVAWHNPLDGLQLHRVLIGDMTLQRLAPRAPLRCARRSNVREARPRRLHRARLSARCRETVGGHRLIRAGVCLP